MHWLFQVYQQKIQRNFPSNKSPQLLKMHQELKQFPTAKLTRTINNFSKEEETFGLFAEEINFQLKIPCLYFIASRWVTN